MTGLQNIVLLLCLAAVIAEVHRRVKFAIDKKHGLNPSSQQVVSHKLFRFRYISSSKELEDDVDMFTYAQWHVADKILERSTNVIIPQIRVSKEMNDLFENKARWKAWMVSIGMGNNIPLPIDPNNGTDHIVFPVVLKSSRKQFGEGVQVIHSAGELEAALNAIHDHERDTVVVEESLLGMGLYEMASFGSSYEGLLLSLRCSLRSVEGNTTTSVGVPFVRSDKVKWLDDYGVACGLDVVGAVRMMMAHAKYTGAFCVNWKMDNQGRMKMLEVNARVCGTQRKAYGDGLVVSAFVSLSFAVLRGNTDPTYQARSPLLHGDQSAIYHTILAMEECALQTGGGMFTSGWEIVPVFNMSLATVPLTGTYSALFANGASDSESNSVVTTAGNFTCPTSARIIQRH